MWLMLNISVGFCQRKQAIVLTWVLHTRPLLPLTWIVLHVLVCSFDVCIKIVQSVAVKRTLALNIRVIVEQTGLFCCCCVDLFQCIDPEWHQEVLFCVLSLSALFLWSALPGCVVPGPALWADSSGSYTTRDLEIILLF